eukprot:GILI01009576.1.p1 GENE.GILI01009576.1~~GILI01009576.1.p1  ORF type:complete len:288 (+),score=69.23 GILI01009576.1:111-974(+)
MAMLRSDSVKSMKTQPRFSLEEILPPQDVAIQDFLVLLEEHKRNCERTGLFAEAELAKIRMQQLREHEEQRQKDELRQRQELERSELERAHEQECQFFDHLWDSKIMPEFEMQAAQAMAELRGRHEKELEQFYGNLDVEFPVRVKYSKAALELKSKMNALASQGAYAEAERIKKQIERQQHGEVSKFDENRRQKIAIKESKILEQQRKQIEALQVRINAARDSKKKQRLVDFEKLLKRYQNIRNDLDSQQNLERTKVEKLIAQSLRTQYANPQALVSSASPSRAVSR